MTPSTRYTIRVALIVALTVAVVLGMAMPCAAQRQPTAADKVAALTGWLWRPGLA